MKIAFHSYKGGVGRTKLMVGVGALLAMQGQRVAMLDFDLDASSLATMFRADASALGNKHMLEVLVHKDPSLAIASMIDVTEFISERLGRRPKKQGRLKYIPTISDPLLANKIDYNDDGFIFNVRRILEASLATGGVEILLVDLRPGYSPASALVFPWMDRAVLVTRLDRSNIDGLRIVVPQMVREDLNPIVVANMVPDDPRTQARIKEVQEATGRDVSVCLEYDPHLIFDDDVGFLADSKSSVLRGLKLLVSLIEAGA